MNLKKMLKNEAITIASNQDVGKRTDTVALLISAIFKDGHIHHILPEDKKIKDLIIEDLISYIDDDTVLNPCEMKETGASDDYEDKDSNNKAPDKVIFKNRQAFGDILTMTSAIRDFKFKFPNTRVGVQTTAMHIWDNNPHIDHSFRSNRTDVVTPIGPGFLTNKSNLWNLHMCNAFRMDIENKLKLKIPQGDIRPDIWFTEEEYNRDPLIKGPYWIFIYGGEPGWPVKQYHRWQEVINILKDDIQFVQLGVKKHPYPVLDNVIDYVGKTEDRNTGIRDLFNIFLHSQGSLGLVSMHMHLSAAFGNPCVVLAGAREPAWFTNYFGHQYIQTNGTLECSLHKACWKCKMEGCVSKVTPKIIQDNHNTKKVPRCVDIIEPEEIAEAIRKYYKGGRLEYGKKIPNTFFENIVKEKKVFSVPETNKVDEDFLKKHGFKWGGGSVTDKDWLFLKEVLEEENVVKILEFGAGLSSLLFASLPKVDTVVTFETSQGWIKKIKSQSDEKINHLFHWDGKELDIDLDEFKEMKFDFAFVDGPAGGQNREMSIYYASQLADLIVVHDAGREWERKWQKKHLEEDFNLIAKGGHRCHLWKRKSSKCEKCGEEKELKEVDGIRLCNDCEESHIEIEDNKKSFRMVTTCRGFGGSERSSLNIMQQFLNKGYRVELISTGNVSGEYQKNIPKNVILRHWNDINTPVDLLCFYTSDTIWNFKKPQYKSVMYGLKAKRKIMILNYQLGGAGDVKWTLNWDKYIFLNSTKESELLKRIPDAKTKVLPPPTDISKFLEVEIIYPHNIGGNLKLIRHNSQKDAKHPEYTNDVLNKIWKIDDTIEFYYMPARSNTIDDSRIHKFKVNQIPVPDFLSKGNCFWYHLPPKYQDQGPRVIIEAMACGLPVIADNSYGAKDRVTPETGWLCDSIDDYYEVIQEILDDMSILEEKGTKARERALEEFVPERWSEEIEGD